MMETKDDFGYSAASMLPFDVEENKPDISESSSYRFRKVLRPLRNNSTCRVSVSGNEMVNMEDQADQDQGETAL